MRAPPRSDRPSDCLAPCRGKKTPRAIANGAIAFRLWKRTKSGCGLIGNAYPSMGLQPMGSQGKYGNGATEYSTTAGLTCAANVL